MSDSYYEHEPDFETLAKELDEYMGLLAECLKEENSRELISLIDSASKVRESIRRYYDE